MFEKRIEMKKKRNENYSAPSMGVIEIEGESLLDVSLNEGEEGGSTGGDDDGTGEILGKDRYDGFYEW